MKAVLQFSSTVIDNIRFLNVSITNNHQQVRLFATNVATCLVSVCLFSQCPIPSLLAYTYINAVAKITCAYRNYSDFGTHIAGVCVLFPYKRLSIFQRTFYYFHPKAPLL